MPKRKPGMTTEEQSEKFRKTVRELIDAGELSPIEAEERFEAALSSIKTTGSKPPSK